MEGKQKTERELRQSRQELAREKELRANLARRKAQAKARDQQKQLGTKVPDNSAGVR